MSSLKDTAAQSNVLDGTIYAYDPVPGEGVHATIAGRDGQVYIVAFDFTDLAVLHRAATAADDGSCAGLEQIDRTRITPAGLPFLADLVDQENGK